MKLWSKDKTSTSALIEEFTVGRDKDFDILLAKYDVQGSIAHVKMLGEVGLMSKEETKAAVAGLDQILREIHDSKFKIEDGMEDVHSQVEFLLTSPIGEAGKKNSQRKKPQRPGGGRYQTFLAVRSIAGKRVDQRVI